MAGNEQIFFLMLLLVYLLQHRFSQQQASLYWMAICLWLLLQPPIIRFEISWEFILALILPLIFWQNARRWLVVDWRFPKKEILLWFLISLSLALIVTCMGNLPWSKAIFFGIVTASLLWQISEHDIACNPLENIGPLTLAILLVETSLVTDEPRYFVGSLFSGAGVGMILALLSIVMLKKMPIKYKSLVSLVQVYLAYWIAHAIGASVITAALISIVVFSEFYHEQINNEVVVDLTSWREKLTFFIPLGLFTFIAWQTHRPAAGTMWFEAGLGLFVGLLIPMICRRLGLPLFIRLSPPWRNALLLGLFLLVTIILWPRDPEFGFTMIWIALGVAVFIPFLSVALIAALHHLELEIP